MSQLSFSATFSVFEMTRYASLRSSTVLKPLPCQHCGESVSPGAWAQAWLLGAGLAAGVSAAALSLAVPGMRVGATGCAAAFLRSCDPTMSTFSPWLVTLIFGSFLILESYTSSHGESQI